MADAAEKRTEKNEEKKDDKKEAAAPKGKKKLFLIIGIAAVVVIALVVGGFLVFKGKASKKAEHDTAAEETASEAEASAAHEEKGGHEAKGAHGEAKGGHGEAKGGSASIVSLDPFIVNLQDNSGTRYLKLTVNIEVTPSSSAELAAQTTKIRDSLIILLSSKSYSDIGSVEGKYQLRDEIIARINQFLSKGKVKTAYFTEFVIQ